MISRKVVNKFLRYFSEDAWALDKRHSKDDVVSDAGQIFAYLLFYEMAMFTMTTNKEAQQRHK